jgi:uncharacterized protein
MKRSSPYAWLAWIGFGLLGACPASEPLPPGDWQGRCAASASDARTKFGPPPTTFVRDQAGMLDAAFESELNAKLRAFQQETCHHLLVVSVASLGGQSLAEYARDYANRVGLGYQRLNNGVLLVVSPHTRGARIQIGCGLEDVIPDAQANAIMQEDFLPAASEGEWQRGIRDSVAALMSLARKKPIPEAFRPEGCRNTPRR